MDLETHKKLLDFNHNKKSIIFYCIGWAQVQIFFVHQMDKKYANSVGRTMVNTYIAGGSANYYNT